MPESKIYTFQDSDRGVDTALLASSLSNNNGMNLAWPIMAMMNGGMNGQWNNP